MSNDNEINIPCLGALVTLEEVELGFWPYKNEYLNHFTNAKLSDDTLKTKV